MNTAKEKYQNLLNILKEYGSIAIAFSGGVDSTFLLKAAQEALGEKAIAIQAQSGTFPVRELNEATAFCKAHGIKHVVIHTNELEIEGFSQNPPDRCYICKKAIFSQIQACARENGIDTVAEGSNMDDNGDYRPGLIAVKELGVASPLRKAELYKSEIRELSKEMGLPTWSKPSFACLASRFVYGETIDKKKLSMVEQAEQYLMDLGFSQFRVRIHGNLARIELIPEEFEKMYPESMRQAVHARLREIGFSYVSMDLIGYRTGSMNETLDAKKTEAVKNAML